MSTKNKEKPQVLLSFDQKISAEQKSKYQEYLDGISGWVLEHKHELSSTEDSIIKVFEDAKKNREKIDNAIVTMFVLEIYLVITLYLLTIFTIDSPESIKIMGLMCLSGPTIIISFGILEELKKQKFSNKIDSICGRLLEMGFKFQAKPGTEVFKEEILEKIAEAYEQATKVEEKLKNSEEKYSIVDEPHTIYEETGDELPSIRSLIDNQ